MKRLGTLLLLGFLLVNTSFSANKKGDDLDPGIYAKITTVRGEILLKLHYDKVPMTVANFVALAEGNMPNKAVASGKPYYDGNKFHRVISDFMIQGGDPRSVSNSNAGYQFKDEFHPELLHEGAGVLSMANAGPATNSTQFFITHKSTAWLNGKHSVFGRVVTGQEVVNAVQQGDKMDKVEIIRVGKEAKNWDALKTFKELSGIQLPEPKK